MLAKGLESIKYKIAFPENLQTCTPPTMKIKSSLEPCSTFFFIQCVFVVDGWSGVPSIICNYNHTSRLSLPYQSHFLARGPKQKSNTTPNIGATEHASRQPHRGKFLFSNELLKN